MKKHLGLAMPVETKGCQEVMAALQGMDAEVGNHFAFALGVGRTRFHAGKLVYMQFIMGSPYLDVVADMTKKLNSSPAGSLRHLSKRLWSYAATQKSSVGIRRSHGRGSRIFPRAMHSLPSPFLTRKGQMRLGNGVKLLDPSTLDP